jgi:hypothetical protein
MIAPSIINAPTPPPIMAAITRVGSVGGVVGNGVILVDGVR